MGSMLTTPNQRNRYSKTKARKSLESLKEKEFNRIQTKMESPDHIYGSLPTRHYQTTLDWGTHQGGEVYTYNKKPKNADNPSGGRAIIENSYTASEYREHLDSQKTRGNPSWEKESASLNKHREHLDAKDAGWREEMKKPAKVPQRHGPPRYRRADGTLMTYPESLELHDWNDRKLRE